MRINIYTYSHHGAVRGSIYLNAHTHTRIYYAVYIQIRVYDANDEIGGPASTNELTAESYIICVRIIFRNVCSIYRVIF